MCKRFLTVLLSMLMVMFAMPAITLAEDIDTADPVVVKSEEKADSEKTDESADVSESSYEDTGAAEENEDEPGVREENEEEPVLELTKPAANAKDVWIDKTEDRSVAEVKGRIVITDPETNSSETIEVYSNKANVIFSTPKTDQVAGMISDAQNAVSSKITELKNAGKISDSTDPALTESTGKVWDNRKYETIEDNDAVIIGDVEYFAGATGTDGEISRTHIATGDYGKETFYIIEAKATKATERTGGYGAGLTEGGTIDVETSHNGSSLINEKDLSVPINFTIYDGDKVTLTAKEKPEYHFDGWYEGTFSDEGGYRGFIDGNTGKLISKDKSYSFTANADGGGLQAVFSKHVLEKIEEVAATCTENGTAAYWKCTECGKMYSDAAGKNEITEPGVIAAGHDWGEWTQTKAPSCTEKGLEERVCAKDSTHRETREIDPLGHDWGAWETLEEATEDTEGLKHRVCARCGEEETQVIPVIDVNTDTGRSGGKSSSGSSAGVKTGDESLLTYWSAVMIAAIMGLLILSELKRRGER